HVLGRISLGVAECLCAAKRLLVTRPRTRHFREDIVRRAIDDPLDFLYVRACKRLTHDPYHRDHAGDGSLVAKLHPGLARGREELVAVLAQELLVGGDDRLALPECAKDVLPRGPE